VIRRLIYLTFAALLLTGVVVAQDVSVRSDHPDEYVVVNGRQSGTPIRKLKIRT
jgi:cell division septal protein FtsQ